MKKKGRVWLKGEEGIFKDAEENPGCNVDMHCCLEHGRFIFLDFMKCILLFLYASSCAFQSSS